MKYNKVRILGVILGFAVAILLCRIGEGHNEEEKHGLPLTYKNLVTKKDALEDFRSRELAIERCKKGKYIVDHYKGLEEEKQERIAEAKAALEAKKAAEEAEKKKQAAAVKKKKQQQVAYVQPSGDGKLTAAKGVNYYNGNKETYYNLPMGGVVSIAKSQGIEGEYWVREDGVKMYGDKIIVAADLNTHPRGSTVETSLGTGIVLDTGYMSSNGIDIAVSW